LSESAGLGTFTLTGKDVRGLDNAPNPILIVHGGWGERQVPHPGPPGRERKPFTEAEKRAAKAAERTAERKAKAEQEKKTQLALKRKEEKARKAAEAKQKAKVEARAREEFERQKAQWPPPSGLSDLFGPTPKSLGIAGLGEPMGVPAYIRTPDQFDHMVNEVHDGEDAMAAITAINAQIADARDIQDALLAISIVQHR
jgi:hypothetical protein